MKYLASTGCLLLHLTTFVSAAPPPEDLDLTRVRQSFNILTDELILGIDTSVQPAPWMLPWTTTFPSNEQSQQPSSVGPMPFTSTQQPATNKAQRQRKNRKQLKASDKREDQERLREIRAQYQRERLERLKASDKPEDQKRLREIRESDGQRKRERQERLKASDKPEDQKLLLDRKAAAAQAQKQYMKRLTASDKPEDQEALRRIRESKARHYWKNSKKVRKSNNPEGQNLDYKATCQRNDDARKSKEGLAGLSTQKRTYIDFSNHVGTSNVHVPSLSLHCGININNGLAQESQIQYDMERYASEHAEWNAGAVCSDSNILERETDLDRPLKRKKVDSNSLDTSAELPYFYKDEWELQLPFDLWKDE